MDKKFSSREEYIFDARKNFQVEVNEKAVRMRNMLVLF